MSVQKILNQWQRKNCGVWATMGILLHKWVVFSIDDYQDKSSPYPAGVENIFIEWWLIEKFLPVKTPALVDYWLRRGEYLLSWTSRWDFSLYDNKWWVIEFDERTRHFFYICENLWDKWKIGNSWWEWWWDKWYWYILKSDFAKLSIPKRIVLKNK